MSITVAFAAMTSAAAVLVTGAPVFAADMAPPAVHVSYADLDLGNAQHQDELNARIGRAARLVCGPQTPDTRSQRLHNECRVDAIADAQAQMTVLLAARDAGTGTGGSIAVRAR